MKKPSVTELVKLLDKPALLRWANQQGLKGIDISIRSKQWLKDGTSMHSQIENYIKNGESFLDQKHQENFENFISDKIIIDIEKQIETQWFQGRMDAKILFNNKEYIVDFKSNCKNVYFEHKLQLVSYGMAENCKNYAIVSIPDFTFIEVEILDTKPFEEIIKALSLIYENKLLIFC